MRTVKIIVFVVVLYILQTAFSGAIQIYNTVPNMVAAFSVLFAFMSIADRESSYVMLACGVLSGSAAGRVFPADVLIIGLASVCAHGISRYMRFVPDFFRAQFIVITAAALLAATGYFAVNKTMGLMALKDGILPYTAYTLAVSVVMYPIIKKVLFKKTDKKLLIV